MVEKFRIPEISYTSRDFESIRDDMIRSIPFFVPEWTDHNPTDFGVAILEMVAYHIDVLNYYIDRLAREGYLPLAIKRESVANLLALIDYSLGSPIPASVDVIFTLPEVLSGPLTIPEGTKLQTSSDASEEPVFYETSSELIIPAGSLDGAVSAIEGVSGDEFLGTSDGSILQRFVMSFERIVDSSIKVFVDEGAGDVEWEKIDSPIFAEPTDFSYTTERSGTPELVTVIFGDNIQGKIPSPGASIRIEFKQLTPTRGDVDGNVGAEVITVVSDSITFLGDPVSLSVINPLPASGGEPEESIEDAKLKGPKSLRALNRAVTEDDYKSLAEIFDGVALANAFVDENGNCCSNICIVIYPEGGGVASSILKEDLLDCINVKKMAGTCVTIKDACEQKIDIQGDVYLRDEFTQEEASLCVNNEIDNYFNIKKGPLDIGVNVNVSSIYPLITSCFNSGVSYVNITKITLQPEANLEIWSGETLFEFISAGADSVIETWTVIFFEETRFTVTGSVSGLQQKIGTVNNFYYADNPKKLSIKIIPNQNISSPQANSVGDRATFKITPILDNVEIPRDCVAVKGNIAFNFIGGTKRKIRC